MFGTIAFKLRHPDTPEKMEADDFSTPPASASPLHLLCLGLGV